ncbi:unnamed protein product [Protopolystoma xenopodis]|uniref:Uncharacterized protein n=1 Tax=Protopolystoma xenopodis TaxID=117903 RepID=A0A448XER7_9PLAT|nr:unnamed protein product [Protopolystoma xenopodis]
MSHSGVHNTSLRLVLRLAWRLLCQTALFLLFHQLVRMPRRPGCSPPLLHEEDCPHLLPGLLDAPSKPVSHQCSSGPPINRLRQFDVSSVESSSQFRRAAHIQKRASGINYEEDSEMHTVFSGMKRKHSTPPSAWKTLVYHLLLAVRRS